MPGTAVYVNAPQVVVPVTVSFVNPNNVLTDPTAVQVAVTDPTGQTTSYVYSGDTDGLNVLFKTAVGKYEIDLRATDSGPLLPGLWNTVWVGSGGLVANGVQVTTGSFRVMPLDSLSGQQRWYVGLDEFKSRSATVSAQTGDDYEIGMAIQAATGWINRYCGTAFYRVTEPRTYALTNIYTLAIDQVVPGSITEFALDYDGDGTFGTLWQPGANYQVYRQASSYNANLAGIKRPDDFVEAILSGPNAVDGGQFFPFTWPFSHKDRVKITATWGWEEVPPEVTQACFMYAMYLYKAKDAPYGMIGSADLGTIHVQAPAGVVDLLRPFIFYRNRFGC